uniref:Caspase-10 n=1 Tax=Microcebus murinus TaxID=30608 RepID=A0A8B7EIK6_MICMU|nr:caspase-10 [Microcebus murinus]XP_012594480.1 caspase-10 [Microcebus murinus]
MAMASQDQWLSSSSDKNCKVNFRERLLIIDSKLGGKDVEQLKFLCQDFVSHKKLETSRSALNIFDLLLAAELLCEEDSFFLAELLYTLNWMSLLKHLNYTKEQVESLLPTQRRVSLFRNLLYELSEGIDSENLQSMIFLLGDSIPKIPMTSLGLLSHLEKQGKIDEDNLTFLEDLCKKIVPKLVEKIEKYKGEKAAQLATLPVDKETESLHQGEEEQLFSRSDTTKLLGALQERPCQNEHARSNGDRATDGALALGSMIPASATRRASPNTPNSEASTEEVAVYGMNRKLRGHCVIINNHTFTSASSLDVRPGTHKDAESLRRVFKWLGFTVCKHDDVTKGRMDEILQEQKSHPDHADWDCFVFCVLTHGKDREVYCSDGVPIAIGKILSHFTANQCPRLAQKPKLFFIQACQGKAIQPSVPIEADAMNPESTFPPLEYRIPITVDFLLGLSTVPGYLSFRHMEEGSWYIQSLCKHLKTLVPRHEDILSILTAVNHDVSRKADKSGLKKQMPQSASTLTKKLVFPVPPGALQW